MSQSPAHLSVDLGVSAKGLWNDSEAHTSKTTWQTSSIDRELLRSLFAARLELR